MLSRRGFFGRVAGGYVIACGGIAREPLDADREEVWVRLVPVTQPAGVLAPREVLFTEWPTGAVETLDLRASDQTWGPFGFDIPNLLVEHLEYHLPETFFNKVTRVPVRSHALYLAGPNTLTLRGLRLVLHC